MHSPISPQIYLRRANNQSEWLNLCAAKLITKEQECLLLLMLFPLRSVFLPVALLFCGVAVGQSSYYVEEPKVFNGGLVGGPNFTQIDGDTFYGYHKVGINAGGVVYVHFSKVCGASLELDYSQKGSRGELVTQSPTLGEYVEKYFMNVNYVEVPATFHVLSHGFDFEAGISYGLLVRSSEWIEADVPVVIDPVANRFNTSDVDYLFGLMRKLYKGWYANARFQYSITSIRPWERVPAGFGYGSGGQYNNMFNLRLMYLF